MVRKHDPVGYLPGRLLPTVDMQWTYYAVRSFWVETGLRFTKAGATTGSARERTPSVSSPEDYLNWWKGGIDTIYDGHDDRRMTSSVMEHPTLRLLYHLSFVLPGSDHRRLSKCHFEDVLKGRFEDLSIKQYTTVQQLVEHAEWSCGSLSQLILESDNIFEGEYIIAHRAAKFVGIAHGLTNALRLSIPIVSTTGKLVIPQDLCSKYGVRSPRYLLSALGQGDMECIQSLQSAVKEIADEARRHLSAARELRHEVLTLNNRSTRTSVGDHVVSVLLPAITSETFLNRLESYHYDLTNRNLRHVNMIEHMRCSMNLVHASMSKRY
jgi:phytoene/squalene synthetase